MNLCRCENGHFYDMEKYDTCPHCAMGKKRDESLTTIFEDNENNGMDATMPLTGQENIDGNINGNFGMADMSVNNQNGFYQNNNQFDNQFINPMQNGFSDEAETIGRQSGIGISGLNINDVPTTDNNPNSFINPKIQSVDIAQEDDDSTMAYWDYEGLFSVPSISKQPTVKSIGKGPVTKPKHTAMSPCAGWVIALNGNHFGQDFRLKVGKNFIGRDSSMDIQLEGDKSVSRNKHAIIVYEPKQHLYLVQPGESSELVYLNNEVVLSPMKLKAYDVITVGEINMLFMPLCGEKFSWSDYLRRSR